MRRVWLALAVVVSASGPTLAGPSTMSNPAFVGIGLQDQTSSGPCFVTQVTPDSSAEAAGLRAGDILLSLDGQPTPDCVTLRAAIVAHGPGERIQMDVIRPGAPRFVADIVLATRAEILRQRWVGEPMKQTDLFDFDHEDRELLRSDLLGHTTIIGWFALDRCGGCSKAFDRVIDALAKQHLGDAPRLVAATAQGLKDLKGYRSNLTAHVPLFIADDNNALDDFALNDTERVSFMVIDSRGVVRFVMPVAADAEDDDGAIDEILAAIEQAEHARRR